MEPGPHTIEVRTGGSVFRSQLASQGGEAAVVAFQQMSRNRPPQARFRLGVALAGTGAAIGSAAAVLLSFEGECGTAVVDETGNCRSLHHTAPVGWSLLGTGTALLLVGASVVIHTAVVQHRAGKQAARKGLK
jgi:hypothetical protein